MTVTFHPCDAVIGAEVRGAPMTHVPDQRVVAAIEEGLEKYGVLIFRGQDITPEQQVAFSRSFGPLAIPQISASRREEPEEILVVGNTSETPVTFSPATEDGELEWHSDHIHRRVPARASLLYARIVPARGGDTLFACMYSAYDDLTNAQKAEYDALEVVNSVAGVQAWLVAQGYADKQNTGRETPEDEVIHPLVRCHPFSGRKALYFGNQVSVGIAGWGREKGQKFIKQLTAHACATAFRYRHKWRVGDAVMWDNRRVLHAGTAYDMATEQRLLHRVTLRETEPVVPLVKQ